MIILITIPTTIIIIVKQTGIYDLSRYFLTPLHVVIHL